MDDQVNFINIEYIFNQIVSFFTSLGSGGGVDVGDGRIGGAASTLGAFFEFFVGIVVPLAIIFLILLLIYITIQIKEIKRREYNKLLARIYKRQQDDLQKPSTGRWDHVLELFHSDRPADWRLGIIEADTMLEELITSMGYDGDTFGEKLKNVDPGNFPALQDAWDVHLVRNKIAHEGMNYTLEEFEKNRIFRTYEKIFLNAGMI